MMQKDLTTFPMHFLDRERYLFRERSPRFTFPYSRNVPVTFPFVSVYIKLLKKYIHRLNVPERSR